MRKLYFCLCENEGADQLRSNCKADQRLVFSSPVRKYRKSYCNHPGVGVRVAQMLKFFIKVFRSLYLLNMSMDQVDTLHAGRYWSEVLCSTIMTHPG